MQEHQSGTTAADLKAGQELNPPARHVLTPGGAGPRGPRRPQSTAQLTRAGPAATEAIVCSCRNGLNGGVANRAPAQTTRIVAMQAQIVRDEAKDSDLDSCCFFFRRAAGCQPTNLRMSRWHRGPRGQRQPIISSGPLAARAHAPAQDPTRPSPGPNFLHLALILVAHPVSGMACRSARIPQRIAWTCPRPGPLPAPFIVYYSFPARGSFFPPSTRSLSPDHAALRYRLPLCEHLVLPSGVFFSSVRKTQGSAGLLRIDFDPALLPWLAQH